MAKRMTRIVPRKVDVDGAIAIVGANIRRLRLGHNMSQETVAELAGLSWRHYQKIEYARSNATVPSLVRIAAALDVDAGELFALPPASRPIEPAGRASRRARLPLRWTDNGERMPTEDDEDEPPPSPSPSPAPAPAPAPAPTEPPASSEDVEVTRDAGPDEPHGGA